MTHSRNTFQHVLDRILTFALCVQGHTDDFVTEVFFFLGEGVDTGTGFVQFSLPVINNPTLKNQHPSYQKVPITHRPKDQKQTWNSASLFNLPSSLSAMTLFFCSMTPNNSFILASRLFKWVCNFSHLDSRETFWRCRREMRFFCSDSCSDLMCSISLACCLCKFSISYFIPNPPSAHSFPTCKKKNRRKNPHQLMLLH